jgi:hypothetical protein
MTTMNETISDLYRRREKQKLVDITNQIQAAITEMDLFFDEYLDIFDERMSATADQKDPVWKAYKDKYKEYQDAKVNLKLANYYIGML